MAYFFLINSLNAYLNNRTKFCLKNINWICKIKELVTRSQKVSEYSPFYLNPFFFFSEYCCFRSSIVVLKFLKFPNILINIIWNFTNTDNNKQKAKPFTVILNYFQIYQIKLRICIAKCDNSSLETDKIFIANCIFSTKFENAREGRSNHSRKFVIREKRDDITDV